jgi:NAD(P)H dehydrogenase (quinone)
VNCVAVFAHPDPASFGAATRDAACRGVTRGGGVVTAQLDLYGDGYRPSEPIADAHRVALETATMLVLVHPTWWGAAPAILHGWLQHLASERWPTLSAVVDVATHGGSRLANVLAGRAGRRTVLHVTSAATAGAAACFWVPCYGLDRASPARRSRLLERCEARLERITAACVARRLHHEERQWSSSS